MKSASIANIVQTQMKFNNIKIDTCKKVLVPRIETEYWTKQAVSEIKTFDKVVSNLKILDIFAGTGCIGIFVLKNLKNSKVVFVDISDDAIEQIKINLELNNINKDRYEIIKSDMFSPTLLSPKEKPATSPSPKEKPATSHIAEGDCGKSLVGELGRYGKSEYCTSQEIGVFDYIFANPPYVAINRIKEVDPNILKNEPYQALFAGQDGMLIIKKFLNQVKNYLKDRGQVFMEFDPDQKPEIEKILKKQNFVFQFKKDQFNKYRYLKAKNYSQCKRKKLKKKKLKKKKAKPYLYEKEKKG